MKIILLTICIVATLARGLSQTKRSISAGRVLTDSASGMKIISYTDGRYCFTYQNVLSQKADPCKVVLKNQEEAKAFVLEIKKAFLLREGKVNKINYGKSQIMLMPASTGAVFMRVLTKGEKLSAFAINRLTFAQIDILR